MFIGHFAVGFAAKRLAPQASLGVLLAAPMLADLLWPIFLAVGWEQVRIEPGNTAFTPLAFDSYPYSHSLLMLALWGAAAGLAYWMRVRDRQGRGCDCGRRPEPLGIGRRVAPSGYAALAAARGWAWACGTRWQ